MPSLKARESTGLVDCKWVVLTLHLDLWFFTALIAETKRAPFDAPEGESEIVAGYFVEYSGMRWSSFMLAEYIAIVGVAALITTLFFGGYQVPWLYHWESAPQWLVTLLQFGKFASFTFIFCWFQIQIRWTYQSFALIKQWLGLENFSRLPC